MAKGIVRRIIKGVILTLTCLTAGIFLITCLTPYLNPKDYWWVGFAGLAAPYLVLTLIFVLIFWLIVKPRFVLIPLVALVIGIKQIKVMFAYHISSTFTKEKEKGDLRIVDWNVQSFNGLTNNKNTKKIIRNDVVASITKLEPDIVCMQEFNHSFNQGPQADNLALFAGEYPYHFFSKDYQRNNNQYYSGCVIFSKYPIINSEKIKYPGAESLIYVDVVIGADTLRVFTTHLQSFKFSKDDYDDIAKIKGQEDPMAASKNIFKKMRPAFQRRAVQVGMIKEEFNKNTYPSVICGDFNDVPNSYTYFNIKGDRQDAFLKKDFGIGRSFISIAPTLRIDYVLPDNNFEVKQFDMVDEGLSDHIMLVCDLRLKKP
ncbi:endonuclease/exonuclease/phosphatase family protein [Chitinophagaceae bacterium LWZ2-11]